MFLTQFWGSHLEWTTLLSSVPLFYTLLTHCSSLLVSLHLSQYRQPSHFHLLASRHSRYSIWKMPLICHMFWQLISSVCNSVRGTGLSCIKLLVGTSVSSTFYLLLFFELLSEKINQIINGDSHCGEICETWFQWIFSSLRVVFKCQELVYYVICPINLLHIFFDWYALQWVRLPEIFPQKKSKRNGAKLTFFCCKFKNS